MAEFQPIDITHYPEIVSAIGAFIAASIGFREYSLRRKESRFERASALESAFSTDPSLRFAITLLDWGTGTIPVPEEFKSYLDGTAIKHDLTLLHEALRPKLGSNIISSRQGTLYRLTFVSLFNHLERILGLWARGYVISEDLPQTSWLTKNLVKWTYAEIGGHPHETWFLPALNAWYPNLFKGQSLGEAILDFSAHTSLINLGLARS
jgi:hypothetical protein